MQRVSSNTSLMAAQMASVSTSTVPSTVSCATRKHSSPTVFTATPSAKPSTLASVTRRPLSRLCAIAFAPAGSTPMTSTSGRTLFT